MAPRHEGIVSPEVLFVIWLIGTPIAFGWWYWFAWRTGGRDFSDLWRPALYSAIGWPFYAFFLVVIMPILYFISCFVPDKPSPPAQRSSDQAE